MISILVSLPPLPYADVYPLVLFTDLEANKTVDEAFADRDEWIKKSIITVARVCLPLLPLIYMF